MIKFVPLVVLVFGLQGCAWLNLWKKDPESVTVVKKAEERVPLNMAAPQPLKVTPPGWIVITPANSARVWKELQDKKTDLVLFALTDNDYERLATDMLSIRNFIEQQRQILLEYKKYYEPEKKLNDPAKKEDKKQSQ